LGLFLKKKYFHKIKQLEVVLSFLPFVVIISLLFENYINEFKRALQFWKTPETRTQAIEYINSIVDSGKEDITIGIAKELRIHKLDLKKLKTNYEIFEHKDINQSLKRCDYLLVGEYWSGDKKLQDLARKLNDLTPQNLVSHIIKPSLYTLYFGKTFLEKYSVNPKVIFLKGLKEYEEY
jgi:hypothetical protein